MTFAPKKAAVVGLGKSGNAAIELLLKRGASVVAFEEKSDGKAIETWRARGVEVRVGALQAGFEKGFDVVVVSPGVPLSRPELKSIATIGEIELAFRCLPEGAGPILGITGTNGKSTTTALLGELMKQTGKKVFVGGNLGRPFAEACNDRYDWHVVELSSFQLEGISTAGFLGSTILNLTPDHLDRYASHEDYGQAKARIFMNPPAGAFAVVNADDQHVMRLSKQAKAKVFTFSRSKLEASAVMGEGGFSFTFGRRPSFTVKNRALRGAHNLDNAMAAALLASLAGADDAAIQRGLDAFPGLAHRLELARELDGVEYINDSKATNVDSTFVALKALTSPIWWIAGGKGKGAPYAPLIPVAQGKVKAILTVGKDAETIEKELGAHFPVQRCGTIDVALRHAKAHAKPGDAVLLSPACASYDQFDNFEHRGDSFKKWVSEL